VRRRPWTVSARSTFTRKDFSSWQGASVLLLALNLLVSVKKGRFRQTIAFDIAAEILKQMPSVTDPFAAQVIVASISAFASLDHSVGTGARGLGAACLALLMSELSL
jgi:hypothetical protein